MNTFSKWALGGLGATALLVVGLVLHTRRAVRRIEEASPPDGQFLEVDGVRLHYVDRGQGPVIVLLHGLAGQLRNFHYLLDRLSARHRVILVDRPGSGHSAPGPAGSNGVRAQAATVARLIRRLGLARPLVVGHSLGGALALALALDHPDCVGELALVSPLAQPEGRVPGPFKGLAIPFPWLRTVLAWTVVVPLARLRREESMAILFDPDPVPPDFETRGGTALLLRPRNFASASADLLAANDDLPGLMARYAKIPVPVRVLFGQGDRVLDPAAHGQALTSRVPGLRLDLIPGGHMVLVTAPDQVARWIEPAKR